MDLELTGKRAVVCGGSRGLGLACAHALAREGVNLTLVARKRDDLAAAAQSLKAEYNIGIAVVSADLASPEARHAVHRACPDPDILILMTPRLSEGRAAVVSQDGIQNGLMAGLISPLHLALAIVEGMCDRRFGRIVTILGSSTKAPLPSHMLTNISRTGLAAGLASLARETARFNVTVNNVLTGPAETEGLVATWSARAAARGSTVETLRTEAIARIPAGRLARPDEVAALCIALCGSRFGHLTGQSIVVDGGALPGLF